ncbi:Hypothetical predicted protein [Mytilus galloprovincialis]|uniref:DZANK-type domain-containing protein n=1 Tax=Mytilus galloprovincialis TaxID=29158 RepID=A0A8B6DI11_MYTGA|nr:Hypothetical predicted protein [Mytilus galloprovincialis]
MKCAKDLCGAEITDGAKFCSICGTKVVVTTIVKKAVCPGCNQLVLESHNFCLNCGWKVDPAIFTEKICKGVKENGEQCRVVLTLDTKFCPTCGTPTNSSDVSTEPIRTEQGTSKEFEKDNSLNPTVSVQKSAIASNDEHETKGGKEDEQLFEQEKKGLHVEKNKHSDESEPGSPEIWTPPTIVLKGSSNSSTEEIGEKTNENQVKVPTETVLLTTDKDKLSDLNEQKEDLQVDTKNTRCNADGDKDFQGDGLNPNNRTTSQQISQPTENYDHNEKEIKENKEHTESITIGNSNDRASDLQREPENPAINESDNGKQLENIGKVN